MTLLTVELNDSEIRIARGKDIILRSPGVAVVNKQGLHVGDEALKLAYLNPRETHDRHWYKLNQDALQAPAKDYRHHADLVYAHLLKMYEQTGNPEELIFTVPGSYSEQQLSMLLGIVAACPFNAIGLVDTAVAGTAMIAADGLYQHLDMHLHHCIITQLEVNDRVTRSNVITIDDIGFNRLYSLAAGLVDDLFIQQSRFDPQHHAETEQLLYNQLPDALATLQAGNEIDLEIHHQNTTHHARLTRDALLKKLRPLYERVIERLATDRQTILADRMLKLPGFSDLLPGFFPSTAATLFESCQKYMLEIRSPGPDLSFITSLPAIRRKKATVPESTAAGLALDASITHVSSNGCAYPLSGQQLYLVPGGEVSRQPRANCLGTVAVINGAACLKPGAGNNLMINGAPAGESTTLKPGDTLHAGNDGTNFQFLRVLNDYGT